MAFGTDIHMEKADAGSIRGEQEVHCCELLVHQQGGYQSAAFKYQDEEGRSTRSAADPGSFAREGKHYNGIPTLEYVCRIEEGGYETEIKLIFFLEEHRWAMIKNSPSAGYQPAEGEFSTKDQEIWR